MQEKDRIFRIVGVVTVVVLCIPPYLIYTEEDQDSDILFYAHQCVYTFIDIVFFVIHFPLALVFGFNREFSSQKAFRIMFILSLCECIVLFSDIVHQMVFIIFDSPFETEFEQMVFLKVYRSLWETTQAVNFVLGYNRLATVALFSWPFFNSKIIYGFMYSMIAGQYIIDNLSYIAHLTIYYFDFPHLSRSNYKRLIAFLGITEAIRLPALFTIATSSLIPYGLLLFYFIKKRKEIRVRKEMSLTIQAFICTLFCVVVADVLQFAYGEDGLPIVRYTRDVLYRFSMAASAIVYLHFNERLRMAYIRLWKDGSLSRTETVTVVSLSGSRSRDP